MSESITLKPFLVIGISSFGQVFDLSFLGVRAVRRRAHTGADAAPLFVEGLVGGHTYRDGSHRVQPMSSQEQLRMPIGEAMFTHRAIRRMKPDPVPVGDIKVFLEAAVKGPNGGNAQPARFLVINDADKIKALGELYLEAWWLKRREMQGWRSISDIPQEESIYIAATRFAEEFGDVPLVVLPAAPKGTPPNSVLPWLQNMMLAARALGIGSVLTTLHPQVDARVAKLFAIPHEVELFGCVPMGYPRGRFGPTSRKPISELAFFNSWGGATPWHG